MAHIGAVFFWYGGVLAPTLWRATLSVISARREGKPPPVVVRAALRDLSGQVLLGTLSAKEYCAQASAVVDGVVRPHEFESAIPAVVDIAVKSVTVAAEIKEMCALWLLLDYPDEWRPALRAKEGLDHVFPDDRILSVPRSRLHAIVPDLFFLSAREAALPIQDCLLLDRDSQRAACAVRAGMAAAVYVDHTRLRREFVLRQMLSRT
jgi:hypothetical protein